MKATNKVPTLDDVVIPGKEVSEVNELPSSVLSEADLEALSQQIEKLIQACLQPLFDKAMQQVITEMKTHFDKKLPELLVARKKV
jgi:proline dehydrogenase